LLFNYKIYLLKYFMGRLSQLRLNIDQAMPELLGLLRKDLPHFIYNSDPVCNQIPVFSFHSVEPSIFRKLLIHLKRNNYSTINMDGLLDHLKGRASPGSNHVVLTFDDGWSTAWSVATPLLKEFGFRATLFLAPATITADKGVRRTINTSASDAEVVAEDRKLQDYLVSWEEVDAMQQTGVWDIQSHTLLHARVWNSNKVIDFASPEYIRKYREYRPWNNMVSAKDNIIARSAIPLGWPIYPDTARMSGTCRFIPDAQEGAVLVDYVKTNGGEKFFEDNTWHNLLRKKLKEFREAYPGSWETEDEMLKSLEYELDESKKILEQRTGCQVRHLLFPWEEGSDTATTVASKLGYNSACWGVLRHRRSNCPGDDPFKIPRVSWKFLPLLPGEGRSSLSGELIRRVKTRVCALF
jgi:peptidoglycan/xylan/chitin deacetylase (PgdA/CDA1 family)